MESWGVSVVDEIAIPIFRSLSGSGGKFLGIFGKSLDKKVRDVILGASKQYEKQFKQRHGFSQVLGMSVPLKIESLNTTVQFLDSPNARQVGDNDELELAYNQHRSRKDNSQELAQQSGIEIANEQQYLMVQGCPGLGKSTFLRRVALEALSGRKEIFQHALIPVFIELKRFISSDIDIEQCIIEEFSNCGFPSPDRFTLELLRQGKLLILLDGLDEVPYSNLNRVIKKVENFVEQYDFNRFIISCRTPICLSGFSRFSNAAVTKLNDRQIKKFIANWFRNSEKKQAGAAEKCWESLQKSENIAIKHLAHTPLLLNFLCLVYEYYQSFPDNRSKLYGQALLISLEKWTNKKGIIKDKNYQGLHKELEELLLCEIAYASFATESLLFSGQQIIGLIDDFLTNYFNQPQNLDAKGVLNTIFIKNDILEQKFKGVFAFSHLTLQEYLAAYCVHKNSQYKSLVVEHLPDERWREVFLLLAGIMAPQVDELLLEMEEGAQSYINTPKLGRLLKWADKITDGSEADMNPACKRALAFVIIFAFGNAFTKSCAVAKAKTNAYSTSLPGPKGGDDTIVQVNPNAKALVSAKDAPNASSMAFTSTIANAAATANAFAVSNAIANAIAQTFADSYIMRFAISISNANGIAIANAICNTSVDSIDHLIEETKKLEALRIFKGVNFSSLTSKLDSLKNKIPERRRTSEVYREFVERIEQTWLSAFCLDIETVDLSKDEAKAIENYFYAVNLMLQCKNTAVKVSESNWKQIEQRMLLN